VSKKSKTIICVAGGMAIVGVLIWAGAGIRASLNRRKVFNTHSSLRVAGEFLDLYKRDHEVYPRTESIEELKRILEGEYGELKRKEAEELYQPPVDPEFLRRKASVLERDAWGNRLRYRAWPKENPTEFRIGSPGRDGAWQHEDLREYKRRVTVGFRDYCFDDDIIFGNEDVVQGSCFG
jgi:hypothetical protein